MKSITLLIISTFLCGSLSIAKPVDTLEIRTLFYDAVYNSKKADELVVYLQNISDNKKAIIEGYRGMSHLLLAKHGYNPYTQLKEFYKGRELLEKAIKTDSENVELRFLRLSVQVNAPFFLNYSNKIEDDKKMIRKKYSTLKDIDLKLRIKNFFIKRKFDLENEA